MLFLPSMWWIPAPVPPEQSGPPARLFWGRPLSVSPAPGRWRPPANRAPAWWWPGPCPPRRWCGTGSKPWPGPAGTAACILCWRGARPPPPRRHCPWCSCVDGIISSVSAESHNYTIIMEHLFLFESPTFFWKLNIRKPDEDLGAAPP